MTTIAFHGQFGSPEMLRVDAGDPDWIDRYMRLSSRNPFHQEMLLNDIMDYLFSQENIVFVGYSNGGRIACNLANSFLRGEVLKPKINGLILYESPLPPEGLLGDMPVVYVRSAKRSWFWWRERKKDNIIKHLKQNHDVTVMESRHGHFKAVTLPDGSSRVGHGWDTSLNERLGAWVREVAA